MFSVIIPLYNKEKSIHKTIISVINQSYPDFEIIIVNDGSTDNSLQLVQNFKDKRIRIINKPNGGVSSARNRGIKEANFEWISFLDGDDLWKPNYLKEVNDLITRYPDAEVIGVGWESSDKKRGNFKLPEGFIDNYFKNPVLWTSAVTVNKKCFNQIGGFNEILVRGEDLDMWSRLAKNFKILYSPNKLSIYRLDSENRACRTKSDIRKSVVLTIDYTSISGDEKKYYTVLLYKKLLKTLITFQFRDSILLLKKIINSKL